MNGQLSKYNSFVVLFRLSKLFWPYKFQILLGVFLSVLSVLSNVFLMAVSGYFIATMAVAGLGDKRVNYFAPAAFIRLLALTRAGSRYAERLVNHSATLNILALLRKWFYVHIEPLSPAVLQKYHSADVFSRIRSDIDVLENVYVRILVPFFVALISMVVFAVFLSNYDHRLIFIELTGLFVSGFVVPFITMILSAKAGKKIVQVAKELRQSVMDSIQGMEEVLIYQTYDRQQIKIAELNQKFDKARLRLVFFEGLTQALILVSISVTVLGGVLIIIPAIRKGDLDPVQISMLVLFILASFEAVMNLPQAFQRIPETIEAGKRIFQMTDQPVPVQGYDKIVNFPGNFDLEFKNVSFKYQANQEEVLKNFNLKIPENSKILIMGPSGEGKSTLINLILRFYDPQSGQILLGGVDIKNLELEKYREIISVAVQDNHLFDTTIRENLLLAYPNATEKQIEKACQAALIDDFIHSLPEKYQTHVGEHGYKLSGGQKKRLNIARMLLKSAEIYILDEPGEGLDRETERKLIRSVLEYLKNKTVIIISHTPVKGLSVIRIGDNNKQD